MTTKPDSNTAWLREQYSDTSRLTARIEAHRRFSERTDSFVAWVIDGLALRPGDLVLDAGCVLRGVLRGAAGGEALKSLAWIARRPW